MGTEHVRWIAEPALTRPVMIFGFTGWGDASDAASMAVRTMIESWGAVPLAEIDPEVFTDFATVRPHVRLDEQRQRSIVWPTVGVWSVSLPGGDVMIMLGPEPALRWRLFSEQLVGIAERCGAHMAISLGSVLADVPHSRPVPVIGIATDDELIDRFDLRRPTYQGPGSIVSVLHEALRSAGLPTATLWAAVPGYASQVPSPKAAMALLERVGAMIGTPAPIASLIDGAKEYDARVTSLVDDDDDMAEYLHQLERLADEDQDRGPENVSAAADDTPVDPDALMEEVEQFLRDRDA